MLTLGSSRNFRGLELPDVALHNGRAFIHAQAEEVGVGEGHPQPGGHIGALVPGPQQPHLRGAPGPVRAGLHLGEGMFRLQPAVQVAHQVHHLAGVVLHVLGAARVGKGRRRHVVAPRGAAHAQVDAAGVQGLQHPEIFRHLQGAVVGEHHTAAAHADGAGVGGHLAHQHFRAGAGKVGQVVVLGQPVAVVAQSFHGHRQPDGFPQGITRGAPGSDGRLVHNAESQFGGQGLLLEGEIGQIIASAIPDEAEYAKGNSSELASHRSPQGVIPAEAGIQKDNYETQVYGSKDSWIRASAGMTGWDGKQIPSFLNC